MDIWRGLPFSMAASGVDRDVWLSELYFLSRAAVVVLTMAVSPLSYKINILFKIIIIYFIDIVIMVHVIQKVIKGTYDTKCLTKRVLNVLDKRNNTASYKVILAKAIVGNIHIHIQDELIASMYCISMTQRWI